VLKYDVRLASFVVGGANHAHDAGVFELRLDPSLVKEPSDEGTVLDVLFANDLHDTRPLSPLDRAGRGSEKNFSHAPFGNALEQQETLENTREPFVRVHGFTLISK
jgi:hypothetical protein